MSSDIEFGSTTTAPKTHRLRKEIIRDISGLFMLAQLAFVAFIVMWIFKLPVPATIAVLQSSMGYVLLIAYPIFLFAILAKRKALGLVGAFVVLSHVFFFAQNMQPATSLPANAKNAPHITLLSHNIRFDNENPLLEVNQITSLNPDLVFLEELTQRTYENLRNSGAFAAYPYSAIDTRLDATGLGIFSKYPLRDAQTIESPGFPQQRAIVNINGRDIVLWNVHAQSPVAGPVKYWRGDLNQLGKRLHAEKGDVLVAGDFNATWGHSPFRNIISHGVREAANDRGQGFTRTWPVDKNPGLRLKGFIRLDHVLTKNNIRPTAIREAGGNGSDHRAVITRLVLLPST